ncbi:MAG: dual specificity protein phosphatase family protein [Anaerolineae bacterium]|nr:dual specificity protein phosphatase family protein [Anaerolineae bacterium]
MNITWIEGKLLACGGIPVSLDDLDTLHDQGVRAIVTLTEHPLTSLKTLPAESLAVRDMQLLHVAIDDQYPPTQEQAEQVHVFVEAMKAEQRPVYLHCHAGIGRTGTMLHAIYLLGGQDFETVKARIKAARPTSQFFMLSDRQKVFLETLASQLKP